MTMPKDLAVEHELSGPEFVHAIFESVLSAIVTADRAGTIVQVNAQTERMFGYAPGELNGRDIKILMPAHHAVQHDGYMHRYQTTGERRIIGIGREVEGMRKDGTTFPIHLSISAFEVAGRHYYTGSIVDLTERNQRAALASTVFEHIPDALIITDPERRIVHCNAAVRRIFGLEPAALLGHCSSTLYADFADFERMRSGAYLAAADQRPVDITFRRSAGDVFPTKTVTAAIRCRDQRLIGFLCIIRDVTSEVEREEALRKAQRMEAYGQLTGGVAHDFNNLLTIIMGNQELLEMRLKDERDRALLKRAQDATEMGARLTNRLLTFARRRRLEPSTVHLNDQLSGLVELLRRTLGAPIVLTCNFAGDLWAIRADPSEIENAVLNLAINARDAMPRGGRLVLETRNVVLAEEDRRDFGGVVPGSYVRLSLTDTGQGMTSDVLARAFEPFFTTKEPGRGTGLGLSTIYGFVKQSGGHVTIYSEPGRGTTVNLYLPAADAGSVIGRPAPAAVPAGQHTETILVVEDNPDVRQVTVERLTELGYRVDQAESGADAKARIGGGLDVDLVFSDVVMAGGVSGLDLARWIEANRPGLKVLLTSGFSAEIAEEAPGNEGRRHFLRKPYSRAELAEAISETLRAPATAVEA